jgi:hypothetical protein
MVFTTSSIDVHVNAPQKSNIEIALHPRVPFANKAVICNLASVLLCALQ